MLEELRYFALQRRYRIIHRRLLTPPRTPSSLYRSLLRKQPVACAAAAFQNLSIYFFSKAYSYLREESWFLDDDSNCSISHTRIIHVAKHVAKVYIFSSNISKLGISKFFQRKKGWRLNLTFLPSLKSRRKNVMFNHSRCSCKSRCFIKRFFFSIRPDYVQHCPDIR